MTPQAPNNTVGLLLSGGLDSSILLHHLLQQGESVRPFFVRAGLAWEEREERAVSEVLAALASPRLAPLVTFETPLADLYGDHWSIAGRGVPDADTPDEAVYLPGRNALLATKPLLWCQMHAVPRLALGSLASNPFCDATDEFFAALGSALNLGADCPVQIVRPFAARDKLAVMALAGNCPLELTFSCIAPRDELHCGQCNKCAERQHAFHISGRPDPTIYAADPIEANKPTKDDNPCSA